MTDDQEKTAPIEVPAPLPSVSADAPNVTAVEAQPIEPPGTDGQPAAVLPSAEPRQAPAMVVRAASPSEREVTFVPLAVSIGDGFKFGCGFFMAMILALLAGFVVLALLFVLSSLIGVNLPIAR